MKGNPQILPQITTSNSNNNNSNCHNNLIADNNNKNNFNYSNGKISLNSITNSKNTKTNNMFILPLLKNTNDVGDDFENNGPINSYLKAGKNVKLQKSLYPFVLNKNGKNYNEEEKKGFKHSNTDSNPNPNKLAFLSNSNLNKGISRIKNTFNAEKLISIDPLKNTFPSKIRENQDKETEEENEKNNMISTPYDSMRYLDFRPYIDDIDQILKTPKDLGYYYKMLGAECKLIKNTLEDNGFKESTGNNFTLLWSSGAIKPEIYKNLKKYQKVNHFPKSKEITRKDSLYKNICKLQVHLKANQKDFNFIPESYILPNEHKFLEESMEKDPNCIWIIKPVASSQGKGIFVTNKIVDIPSGPNLIVSKYIWNPFLIDGYKFDIRIYVVITSIMPLRIYIYEEGLVRFATEKYFIGQPFKNNRFMHLTNYSLNKNSKNFIPNNDPFMDNIGSKWSLSALKSFFDKNNINTREIFDKIDDIIIKTILSAEDTINTHFQNLCDIKNGCFELFGFDILLDSSLNPWLLEVNLSPSMNCDSPLDQKIKSELIAECFNLTRIVPFYMRNQESIFSSGNNQTRNIEKKILKETANLEVMKDFKVNKEIRETIWEAEEELKRLKTFRRIFPTINSLSYRKYFYNENPINLYSILYALETDENIDIDQFRKMKKLNLKNFAKK